MSPFSRRSAVAFVLLMAVAWLLLSGCHNQAKLVIRAPADVATARIGVMTGSTGEIIAKTRFPQADIQTFDDIMNAVAAIEANKLDAVITSLPTAQQVAKKHSSLYVVPEPLDHENTSIAVSKGNDKLLKDINRIISDLKADGTLASMRTRWLKSDLSPYEVPKIELPDRGTPLRVGVAATREPLTFVDADGSVTGHDGELARRIAAGLHRPIEFQNMKFLALIPALASGKIDCVITGMTATDERRKSVDLSMSYFDNSQVLLTIKPPSEEAATTSGSSHAKMRTPDDLSDKKIGVLMGSADSPFAHTRYPGAKILEFQSAPDIVLAVKTKKVDAALYDAVPLGLVLREEPGLAAIQGNLYSFNIGAGFQKDNAALRTQFNGFLAEIRKNGSYDDMVKRWIDRGDTGMPHIELPASRQPLVVGVSDGGMPFVGLQENRFVGFDVELASRFAASIGRPIRFDNMQFGGLIAAVSSGKADMILSSIYITEERQKQIAFSDPYFEEGSRAFALKERLAASDTDGANRNATTALKHPSFLRSIANSFDSNLVQERRYLLILDGLKTTIVISLLATIFGTLLGALVCYMRMSKLWLLRIPAKIYIDVLRGTPVLVLLMLIFYVVFASLNISAVLVAVIAFGMNFAAYVSEMYRAGIESIDRGQTEAAIAIGFTPAQSFFNIVLPQTIQRILPVYKGEFISLVKMTSIVGYIAVQDLTKASDIIRSRTFDAFSPLIVVAILYFAIAWLLTLALERVEIMTNSRRRRVVAR
ncbi:MAG TPA: ABC transporter substrate-binding protein/permease [Terracidiphilus sp.]|jgi:polar amino acid transport system substrate-binding protein